MIYFDKETQEELISKMTPLLVPRRLPHHRPRRDLIRPQAPPLKMIRLSITVNKYSYAHWTHTRDDRRRFSDDPDDA